MYFITLKDLKRLVHPHHLINFVLAASYLFTKLVQPFCSILYPKSGCELEFVSSLYSCSPCILTIDNYTYSAVLNANSKSVRYASGPRKFCLGKRETLIVLSCNHSNTL